jgi:hypothetical protein
VVVPNIAVDRAFDEALKDVVYVEHIASLLVAPVSFDLWRKLDVEC